MRGPRVAAAALAVLALLVAGGCGGGGSSSGPGSTVAAGATTPAGPQGVPPPEGSIVILAQEGYVEGAWLRPFERRTGCKADVRYLTPDTDAPTLLTSGHRYDVVVAG